MVLMHGVHAAAREADRRTAGAVWTVSDLPLEGRGIDHVPSGRLHRHRPRDGVSETSRDGAEGWLTRKLDFWFLTPLGDDTHGCEGGLAAGPDGHHRQDRLAAHLGRTDPHPPFMNRLCPSSDTVYRHRCPTSCHPLVSTHADARPFRPEDQRGKPDRCGCRGARPPDGSLRPHPQASGGRSEPGRKEARRVNACWIARVTVTDPDCRACIGPAPAAFARHGARYRLPEHSAAGERREGACIADVGVVEST